MKNTLRYILEDKKKINSMLETAKGYGDEIGAVYHAMDAMINGCGIQAACEYALLRIKLDSTIDFQKELRATLEIPEAS